MLEMKTTVKLNFDKSVLKSVYEKRAMVGVFKEDNKRKQIKPASEGYGTLVKGLKKRKIKNEIANQSGNADVLMRLEKQKKVLSSPFTKPDKQAKASLDLFATTNIKNQSDEKMVKNSLTAIIRQAIAKKRFGGNSKATIKRKGFSHYALDSGQLFKALKTKLKLKKKKTFTSKIKGRL